MRRTDQLAKPHLHGDNSETGSTISVSGSHGDPGSTSHVCGSHGDLDNDKSTQNERNSDKTKNIASNESSNIHDESALEKKLQNVNLNKS